MLVPTLMSGIELRRYGSLAVEGWGQLSARVRALVIGYFIAAILIAVAWQRCWFLECPDVHRLSAYGPGRAVELLDRDGRRSQSSRR